MSHKSRLIPVLVLTAFFAAGCVDVQDHAEDAVEYETVYLEAGEPPVRASLEEGAVLWDPGDNIQVCIDNGGIFDFTALTEERSTWTVFSGSVPVGTDLEGGWAVYPRALYSTTFLGSLSTVTVQLDSVQTAVNGTFASGGIISVAKVSGSTLHFKHVCSGVKFRLVEEGITSVTLQSRGGETLAGIARVSMKNDTPYVSSMVRSASSVTLEAPKGECLDTGVWYYVSCLPSQLSKGVALTLHRNDDYRAIKEVDGPVTLSQGRVGRVDSLGRGMTFVHRPVLETDVEEVEFATAGGDAVVTVRGTMTPDISSDAGWLAVTSFETVGTEDGITTWRISLNAGANGQGFNLYGKLSLTTLDSGTRTVNLVQRHGYESTDYSADGRVTVLQSATEGRGIDLVVMGDAFTDRLVADGTYRRWMEAAAESFFTVAPVDSFRQRFNVYMVDVISRNEDYGSRMSHALGTSYENSKVSVSESTALQYAAYAAHDMANVTVIVVMNSTRYGGVAYPSALAKGEFAEGSGVAFVPHCGDPGTLGALVHHEAVGHAFAKLADEYVTSGVIPDEYKAQYQQQSEDYGWWCNVDFTSDPSAVKWSRFLDDPRYALEGLGVFEGGITYVHGVWRPSFTSIMISNYGTFNAPSREMIYKRIRHLSEGDEWQYDYDEFVRFDLGPEL